MHSNTTTEKQNAMSLEITQSNGVSSQFVLREEASVFVGSSATCGLRIQGIGVEDLHCMLLYSKGQATVRDWHTGSTMLNGECVSDEATLQAGDEIQIGENRIVLRRLLGGQPLESGSDVAGEPEAREEFESEPRQLESVVVDEVSAKIEPVVPCEKAEPRIVDVGLDGFDFDPEEDLQSKSKVADDSECEEEALLLEIERLRIDLAQRDAEIMELRETDRFELEDDDETTERLVVRLEELLDELKGADERVSELEQLLRLADDANQAECEEREQLEAWVREIEQRVSQRESETEAERERLQSQLNDTREQLDSAESQVRRVLNSESGETADASLVQELQQQNEQLESRYKELTGESNELRERLENSEELELAMAEVQRLEQAMLQMEVETSRERAEIARDSAELRRAQDELERQMKGSEMSDSDTRLVVMREQLRERFEQESVEREDRRSRSLGGRISRLLKGSSR